MSCELAGRRHIHTNLKFPIPISKDCEVDQKWGAPLHSNEVQCLQNEVPTHIPPMILTQNIHLRWKLELKGTGIVWSTSLFVKLRNLGSGKVTCPGPFHCSLGSWDSEPSQRTCSISWAPLTAPLCPPLSGIQKLCQDTVLYIVWKALTTQFT